MIIICIPKNVLLTQCSGRRLPATNEERHQPLHPPRVEVNADAIEVSIHELVDFTDLH